MSEGRRVIRINKVLRELNISLDRAVEFLKDKGFEIESSPNAKISKEEYTILCSQFSADKGKKEASIEVSEEKRKEKEALKKQIEKENELKKEREHTRQQEIIRAKAKIKGPKSVGKIEIDANKKKELSSSRVVNSESQAKQSSDSEEQVVAQVVKQELDSEKPTQKEKQNPFSDKDQSKESKVIKEDKKSSVDELPKEQEKKVDVKKNLDNQKDKIKVISKSLNSSSQEKKLEKTEPVKLETSDQEKANSTEDSEKIKTKYQKLSGATFTGQVIDLSKFNKPKKKKEDASKTSNSKDDSKNKTKKRKRITKPANKNNSTSNNNSNRTDGSSANKKNFGKDRFRKGQKRAAPIKKVEPTEEEVKNQIKETLERLQGKGNKSKSAKYRKEKRDSHKQRTDKETQEQEKGSKVLKVTEFVTVGEVASMMDVPVTQVIGTCMTLGIMVTMNQRLDADTLSLVADEFGYEVQVTTADIQDVVEEVVEKDEDLVSRAPIVTVMGHVDHGKTSFLDYVRKANVIAGESGGITQHIGAYGVTLESGQKITFLDTPGHEAFTAMRARGAQVTDIAIIVIAADDDIMPQTKEAISHAQAAGVPMIFAINKVDKSTANPDKIKEKLAAMNLLVEEWGGKYQSHDISAKTGMGVTDLLEKVLLEAELLELKANPDKSALGTIVEAQLDKGRGYVATILVQAGTLKIGDYVLAGKNHGKIKAMFDERGQMVMQAGPSTPVSVLGLDGAPGAGDKFNVYTDEREAKQIAAKRTQLLREQSLRTQKHITLAEIGRRIALGQFKELNIILKGDVDGSVEALSDSFLKLSTEEIQINIIHKGVGAITESDVLLASASDAVIIGFNVRPQGNAKSLAEKEEIDIRNYSIIYDAIDDLKDAMEGMLSPELKEEITGTAEIRELFKISKVGTIAGCMVTDGKIFRNNKIRLIREGVVVYTGELVSLKRFKDDVKDVSKGYDCGLQIKNYNDLKELDVIESFHEIEVKKKLK